MAVLDAIQLLTSVGSLFGLIIALRELRLKSKTVHAEVSKTAAEAQVTQFEAYNRAMQELFERDTQLLEANRKADRALAEVDRISREFEEYKITANETIEIERAMRKQAEAERDAWRKRFMDLEEVVNRLTAEIETLKNKETQHA